MKIHAAAPTLRLSISALTSLFGTVAADIAWPEYNQQCRDDAGPSYLDDEPGVPYHAGSAAYPVLASDGTCAGPLREACGLRDDYKTAYLEGECVDAHIISIRALRPSSHVFTSLVRC